MRNRKLLRKAHETAVAEERQRQRQRESQTADESGAEVIVYDPVGSHVHSTRRRMKFFKFHENNRPAYFGTASPAPSMSLALCALLSLTTMTVQARTRRGATAFRRGTLSSKTPSC
jgi:hypothetical protein